MSGVRGEGEVQQDHGGGRGECGGEERLELLHI